MIGTPDFMISDQVTIQCSCCMSAFMTTHSVHYKIHGFRPITCADILYSSKDSPVSKLVVFLVGALVVRGNQSFILSCMRSMSACYRFLGCWGSVFEAWLLVCCILWLAMTSNYIAMAMHIRWKWLVPISFYSSRMLGASMMPPTRNLWGRQ